MKYKGYSDFSDFQLSKMGLYLSPIHKSMTETPEMIFLPV